MAFDELEKDKAFLNPAVVSSTASHQHQQEQEMLSGFTVPEPPVATQQLTLAAENDPERGTSHPEAPRTLWMGDLDPWLDEAAIVDLWWQMLGKQVGVKVIKPKQSKPEGYMGLTHLGYCFVEFGLYEDAQQALALNGQLLPDMAMPSQQHFPNNPDNQKKYFRLNWALGATLSAPIVHTPEYSLFVGDLSALTTEAHLLSFFQKAFSTSIKTVRVMTDPVSGKSRCFGFVRFTDDLERQRALVEMNGAWFGGRPLRVALATPRTLGLLRKSPSEYDKPLLAGPPGVRGPAPPPYDQEYMFMPPGVHAPGGMGSQPYYMSPEMMQYKPDMGYNKPEMMPYMPAQPYLDPGNTTVFVGGLLSEVSEQTLFTLFKPFGLIQQIKIPPGKNCGFLKYSTREEAEEAILAMEGFIIGGNRVRLGWGRVSINNKKYHQQRHQIAQVAQMQAAAALSMGMDPAAAYAAAAGYPQGPGLSQGYMGPMGIPQMGMGMYGHPDQGTPNGELGLDDLRSSDGTSQTAGSYGADSERDNFFHYGGPGGPDLLANFEKLSLEGQPPHVHHQHPQGIFVPYGGYAVPPDFQYAPPHPEETEASSVPSTASDVADSKAKADEAVAKEEPAKEEPSA